MANISPEALSLIDSFSGQILSLFKDIKNEMGYFLNDGLLEYENSQYNKFIKTKTFLYRNENVNFYDIYFPLYIKSRAKRKQIKNNVNELFEKTNYIGIVGNAGSGKTMLMKYIFLEYLKNQYKIPLVIELRNLNDFKGNITDYISYAIFNNKLSPDKRILERLLDSGKFLFLFDGYDELYSDNKMKITHDLDSFIDKYPKNDYLITSRPGANVESIPRFDIFHVCPLGQKEIEPFIRLQLRDLEQENKFVNKIMNSIKKPENRDYNAYLTSPLLLSMFILTFESYPELPKTKSKFYWNVFDTLCTKHDSITKKGGFLHERKTKLLNEEIELILKWFSYISLFEGKYSFDAEYLFNTLKTIKDKLELSFDINLLIDDLTVAVGIIIIDGLEYKFPHKSLQEYFTILLIKEQSENNKVKIYAEKLNKLNRKSLGGNLNFWNLCYELDKISFLRNFLLVELDNILKNYEGKTHEKMMFQYFDDIKPEFGFDLRSKDVSKMYSVPNSLTSLISFFSKRSIWGRIYFYNSNPEDKKKISEFVKTSNIRDKDNFIRFNEYNRAKKIEFYKLIHLDNIVFDIIQDLKKEQDSIRNTIEKEGKMASSLLDI